MIIKQCKYCGSKNLILDNKTQLDIIEANQVALKCADCGKYLKWCPKDEREFYIKANQGYQDYQEVCRLEEYQRWADKEITRLNKELAITDKALALAVETMRYELGRTAIKNLYDLAIKNYKDNPKMTFDYDICDWFKEKAKELRNDNSRN